MIRRKLLTGLLAAVATTVTGRRDKAVPAAVPLAPTLDQFIAKTSGLHSILATTNIYGDVLVSISVYPGTPTIRIDTIRALVINGRLYRLGDIVPGVLEDARARAEVDRIALCRAGLPSAPPFKSPLWQC